jgi:putative glycosyltransferase (TIGR04348 family)
MLIRMICPAPPGSLYGNRVTAVRWAGLLKQLGHRVVIASDYLDEPCDLMIALHAKRSAGAVFRYRKLHQHAPLVVALTGTDLYRDLRNFRRPHQVLDLADLVVSLQPLAAAELSPPVKEKLRVIYQSAELTRGVIRKSRSFFDVSVVGHLRPVKDPFRAAYAARRLPAGSRIRVLHAGQAMGEAMARQARAEEKRNPRYRWLGPLSRARTRRLIAQSRILVLSSRLEGGANVISEAAVDGTPILASRIPGSIGLLGEDHPGYYLVGDTQALSALLVRAENDAEFYRELAQRSRRIAPLFRPSEERRKWRELLAEISRPGAG